jgi:hypothetical protein
MNDKLILIIILIVIFLYIIGSVIYLNSRNKWPVVFKLENKGKINTKISISINGKFLNDISLAPNQEQQITIDSSVINWMNNLPLKYPDLLNISLTTDSSEKIQFSSTQNLVLYKNGKIVRDITGPGTFYIYFP